MSLLCRGSILLFCEAGTAKGHGFLDNGRCRCGIADDPFLLFVRAEEVSRDDVNVQVLLDGRIGRHGCTIPCQQLLWLAGVQDLGQINLPL